VLAPIVEDPARAVALPGSLEALRRLAATSQTDAAVVSGRARADLAGFLGGLGRVQMIGCHGAEGGNGLMAAISPETTALVARLDEEVRRIARFPGMLVERKPVGVAFHFRKASEPDAEESLHDLLNGPARWPGVRVRHGKMVVELFAVDASK